MSRFKKAKKKQNEQKRLLAESTSSSPNKKQRIAATTDLDLDQVDAPSPSLGDDAPRQEMYAATGASGGYGTLPGGVMPDELDVATEVMTTLAADASAMKGKEFKAFKVRFAPSPTRSSPTVANCRPRTPQTALYNLNASHALASGLSTSLASRISSALTDGRWLDARIALSEMRLRAQRPRLGALQRWVRECDAASAAVALGPDAEQDGQDGGAEPNEVWLVLEAILRCTTEEGDVVGSGKRSEVQKGPKPVVWMEEWGVGSRGEEDLWEDLQSGKLLRESFSAFHKIVP